jgi:hypothetical protein
MNANDAKILTDTEIDLAKRAAIFVGVLTGTMLISLSLMTVATIVPLDLFRFLAIGLVFVAGMLVLLFVVLAFLRGRDHLNDFRHTLLGQEEWRTEEIKAQIQVLVNAVKNGLPTATETAYLPNKTETFQLTAPSGAGGAVVTNTIAKELVNGFDPRDLNWFATYLANGNAPSETRLERMPLPYGGGNFGGLTEGTNLSKLLDLCEARGILSPRDAERRKPGKLLITDEHEIARLLKETT